MSDAGIQVSESEWSLPMNRAELIARCEALEAALRKIATLRDDCGHNPWQTALDALGAEPETSVKP